MNLKKIIKNIFIIAFLLLLLLIFLYFPDYKDSFPSALKSFRQGEKSSYYGPSKVVYSEKDVEGEYILSVYEDYYSCAYVEKTFKYLERYKNSLIYISDELDPLKNVSFQYGPSRYGSFSVFGKVNDESIVEVRLFLKDGSFISKKDFTESLFLIYWDSFSQDYGWMDADYLEAYDVVGQVVFKEKI